MTEKRAYKMRERAKSQEETRKRIVEAAMELHENLGPSQTTISAIAERAGVQRLTVYRHFADETAIFQACTAHWLSLNPPPAMDEWDRIEDPKQRLKAALSAFYDYYEKTQKMWAVTIRDVDLVPALQEPYAAFCEMLRIIVDQFMTVLADKTDTPDLLRACLHHVFEFSTWQSLNKKQASNEQKTTLAMQWVFASM